MQERKCYKERTDMVVSFEDRYPTTEARTLLEKNEI